MRFTATCASVLLLSAVPIAATQQIDLAERFAGGKLRTVNREVSAVTGDAHAVHMNARPGNGVAWIDGVDFAQGTIEVNLRGKNVPQQSFIGIAFHRKDDQTYEAIYLRPFNFRAADPAARAHAVQYISLPDYDWARLRQEKPGQFEHDVDQSLDPTGWVPVRVVVKDRRVQVFVGKGAASPALDVPALGSLERGAIGLWVGNNSDGDFSGLQVAAAK
jgi:hypothetical protein